MCKQNQTTAGSKGTIINPQTTDLRNNYAYCDLQLLGVPQFSLIEFTINNINLGNYYCRTCRASYPCNYISVVGIRERICHQSSTPLYLYKHSDPIKVQFGSTYFKDTHTFNITYRG